MPDALSPDVVKAAFIRSDGECECAKSSHEHSGRCNKLINYHMRGMDLPGGWEARRINKGLPPDPANCRILCMDCYKAEK